MSNVLVRRILLGCGLAVWIGALAAGFSCLAFYDQKPGAIAAAPKQIAPLASNSQKHQLLMFVHPRCPCSMASMRELERLMGRCQAEIDATVYFIRPNDQPEDWIKTSLWTLANQIPGVRTEIDVDGKTAARFAAKTSGSVVLYDSAGQLKYQGGITAARGHEGDSLGKSAIFSLVRGDATPVAECPVYGCALRSNASPVGQ